MKTNKRIHASVPCDKQEEKDEISCEGQRREGGLVEHVEKKAGSVAIERILLLMLFL